MGDDGSTPSADGETMLAAQVVSTTGPEGVEVRQVPRPAPVAGEVLIDVHAVGVSFPDLLLSKGQYQLRPEPPFTLGGDCAGIVVADAGPFRAGQRVAAVMSYGAASGRVSVPQDQVFALPPSLDLVAAAGMPLNYLTAHFALARRADLRAGETVLVHGAAGGVGTACLQVARALGARTIAVVSSDEKAEIARRAGAGAVVPREDFAAAVRDLTAGAGVDVVVDVVGGDVVTDSLRILAPLGRFLVVGFAAGQGIPEVRVNRLLLNNIDVRGVGWGAYAYNRPGYLQQQWSELVPMIERGEIASIVGRTYPLEDYAQALADLDERRALGKSVVLLP
jgi:NADPH2:quinone reductase